MTEGIKNSPTAHMAGINRTVMREAGSKNRGATASTLQVSKYCSITTAFSCAIKPATRTPPCPRARKVSQIFYQTTMGKFYIPFEPSYSSSAHGQPLLDTQRRGVPSALWCGRYFSWITGRIGVRAGGPIPS